MSGPREIKDPDLGAIRLPAPPKKGDSGPLFREQQEASSKRRIGSQGSVSKCPPQCFGPGTNDEHIVAPVAQWTGRRSFSNIFGGP